MKRPATRKATGKGIQRPMRKLVRARPLTGEQAFTAEALFNSAKSLSRCIDGASLKTLEAAHALLGKLFFEVIERGSLANAAEQRVLGLLWAEIELAIDQRKKKR